MAATNTQLSDAARDAALDVLETGEEYEIDGQTVKRDLTHIQAYQDQIAARASRRRPMFTKLRVSR